METWRDDPFLPVGYKTPPDITTRPPIPDFPFFHFQPPPKSKPDVLRDEPPQPIRRLAGVMINDQVCAIIESAEGVSQVYQPGQRLEDGLAVVEKIEADKVILKTKHKPSRYLVLRLAAAPSGRTSAASITSTTPTSPRPISGPFRPGDRPRPIE